MPLIEVKVFQDELDADQSKDLIHKITDAVVETTDEALRDKTWVLINEVKDGHWGVGGAALTLGDVQALIDAK